MGDNLKKAKEYYMVGLCLVKSTSKVRFFLPFNIS